MKRFLIHTAIVGLVCFGSCIAPVKEREATGGNSQGEYIVSLHVTCPEMELRTRALDPSQEKRIADLNIYFYHKTLDIARHIYSKGSTDQVVVSLFSGDYDLYALANAGRDLGEQDKTDLEKYRFTFSATEAENPENHLPMSASQSISVRGNTDIRIGLIRCVARIDLNLSVDAGFSDRFTLESLQLINAPASVSAFSENRPATEALCNYSRTGITGNALSYSFYTAENMQGVNGSITDPKDKNRQNAPKAATYLHVQGSGLNGKADYFIYLGENTTSDFNVRRNGRYIMDVRIMGDNDVDTRVSTVEMELTPFPETEYEVSAPAYTELKVTATNDPDNLLYLTPSVPEGGGTLQIDGITYPEGTPILFCTGNESRTARVTLLQDDPGQGRIRFTLGDSYGYSLSREATALFVEKSYPVITSYSEQPWDREAHTPLEFSIHAAQQDNTAGFTVRYELLQGSAEMFYDGTPVAPGATIRTGASDPDTGRECPFRFTPTDIGTARIRLTFTGANGQTSVVEKEIDRIIPYQVFLTPDFAEIRPAGTIVSSDGYSGIYYKNFTLRLLVSANRELVKPVTLGITLQYRLGRYETSPVPTVSTRTETGDVTIEIGSRTGSADLTTYPASCIGYNAGMGSKIIYPGYYVLRKNNYGPNEHEQDAAITACRITSDTDRSIEYIINDPPK